METIYDFTDEMMSAHNILKEARDKFAELVEIESRSCGLTERHRGRWITKVHDIEKLAPVMIKEGAVVKEDTGGPIAQAMDMGDSPTAYKDMPWHDLKALAKERGHKTHGLKRLEIEELLS